MTESPVNCDLCGKNDFDVIFKSTLSRSLKQSDFSVMGELGEYPQVVQCRSCGLRYANPRDEGDDLAEKYRELSVSEYLEAEESRRLIAGKDANFVRRYKTAGRVLDVGCSAGIFLSALGKAYEKIGIEPSRQAADAATKKLPDARIYNDILEEASINGERFDVITLWDVIEHLPSPSAALRHLHGLLADDGIIVLVTPDIGSWLARIMGPRWTHLIRGHIFYFTRKSMKRMLDDTLFETVSIKRYRRYFKIGYILQRVGVAPNMPDWLKRLPPFNITVPVDLGDAMLVVARKK